MMNYSTQPANTLNHPTPCLVVPVFSNGESKDRLPAAARQLDQLSDGAITDLLERGDIDGKVGQSLLLPTPPEGINAERLLLLGCGAAGTALSKTDFAAVLKELVKQLTTLPIESAFFAIDGLAVIETDTAWRVQQSVLALEKACYRYRHTVSEPKPDATLTQLTFITATHHEAIANACQQAQAIAQGINVARDLGDLPANICTPPYLAERAKNLHSKLTTSVLDEAAMRDLGMNALLAVGAGSVQPSQLIIMQYQGAANSEPAHILVGKGITFDSGGISLKPGAQMDEMKYDMCGAASVFGALVAVAEMALPINVVGIVAAAENLPGGSALKPSDVITSMSGQTIEILNTDAEGRLVLCDALTYAQRHFTPHSIIDIATLTGACVVALGKEASGLYSSCDEFAAELLAAGEHIGDLAWQMPLWEVYQEQLKTPFADMANVGGREAGSITAACFLARFTKDIKRWAHLDVAGTARQYSGENKGGTGRPVGLLVQYLINQCRR